MIGNIAPDYWNLLLLYDVSTYTQAWPDDSLKARSITTSLESDFGEYIFDMPQIFLMDIFE